jgi:hypothetical protein
LKSFGTALDRRMASRNALSKSYRKFWQNPRNKVAFTPAATHAKKRVFSCILVHFDDSKKAPTGIAFLYVSRS